MAVRSAIRIEDLLGEIKEHQKQLGLLSNQVRGLKLMKAELLTEGKHAERIREQFLLAQRSFIEYWEDVDNFAQFFTTDGGSPNVPQKTLAVELSPGSGGVTSVAFGSGTGVMTFVLDISGVGSWTQDDYEDFFEVGDFINIEDATESANDGTLVEITGVNWAAKTVTTGATFTVSTDTSPSLKIYHVVKLLTAGYVQDEPTSY